MLFGDLVGFTALSESLDPEEVRELLSAYFTQCRTIVGRYGGLVEKFIGDAVMAIWGVPVAHEDDAERAVRAGLELVSAIADNGMAIGVEGLAVRVGIVTGEVAVTVGATGQGIVAGDAVNTASRVQSVAQPGRVWVDETTRSLASAAISFTDAGEHILKGKTDPTHLWTAGAVVAEVGGSQRVDGLEAPLTGRARELRLIKELFHATQESRRPRLLVVDGEAGIGKSRLVWEFEKYVDGLSAIVRWHRGRCLSYGDGVAFRALAEAIRGRLGLLEGDTIETITDQLEVSLNDYVPEAEERDWLRPRLGALIGSAKSTSVSEFTRDELFAAWTAFLEYVGGDGVVVLVIDDAHNADEGLLDFVDKLLAVAQSGVFVVALARPELLVRRPEFGGRRATIVRLDPIGDTAMVALVGDLVFGLSTETRAAIVERAEGVPLFAVETVRALIDRDLVVPVDGRYAAAPGVTVDLDAIGAPATLQALAAARLGALSSPERRVVAAASVLGAVFTHDGLTALLADSSLDLKPVIASLIRKEILSIQTDRFSAERGQYRFVQSIVRQSAYVTQSRRDRKNRHIAVATHLSAQSDPSDDLAALIAQHLLDAVDASAAGDPDIEPLSTRAGDLLERGARRASTLGAPADALRLLESAFARTQVQADLARLQLAAAAAAAVAGRYPQSTAHAEQAIAWFDDHNQPVDAALAAVIQASNVIFWLQDNSRAIAIAEPRWHALENQPGAEKARLKLAGVLSVAHQNRGENDELYNRQAITLAEALQDHDQLARGLTNQGIRYQSMGAPLTSLIMLRGAVGISRDHNLTARLAHALTGAGAIAGTMDLSAGLELLSEAVEVAPRSGDVMIIEYTRLNYMLAIWTAGRFAEVRTLLETPVSEATAPFIRLVRLSIELWLADATGETPPAVRDVGQLSPDSTDDIYVLEWLGPLRIPEAISTGDACEVAQIAESCLSNMLMAGGLGDDFVHLWPRLVLAALAIHDVPLAERLLEPVATAAAGAVPRAVAAHYQRLHGLVGAARADDPAEVETRLRAGVAALDGFGAAGMCAQAMEELGRWLFERGRTAEGKTLLDKARTTYREIGANGWLARLDTWHNDSIKV